MGLRPPKEGPWGGGNHTSLALAFSRFLAFEQRNSSLSQKLECEDLRVGPCCPGLLQKSANVTCGVPKTPENISAGLSFMPRLA